MDSLRFFDYTLELLYYYKHVGAYSSMPRDEEFELIKYILQEIKDQYKIYLEGFSDIKKKNQILLLICSLIIALPLSNSLIIEKIYLSHNIIIASFLSGVISLVLAIFFLIFSMKEIPVRIPLFDDIIGSLGKYEGKILMISVAKAYSDDLYKNTIKIEARRNLVRIAEKFIIAGVILLIGALIFIFMFQAKT